MKLNGKNTRKFRIEKGVRQGACSSPMLFNLVPDKLAKTLANLNVGIRIDNDGLINILLYADDIALVAKTTETCNASWNTWNNGQRHTSSQ